MYGWLVGKNINIKIDKNWKLIQYSGYQLSYFLLNKFPDDIVNNSLEN